MELAFTGVADMENGRAVAIANDLVRREILFKKPSKPGEADTFAAMSIGGDFAEIERLKKSLADNVRTAELVDSAKLIETITLTPSQKCRYLLYPVAFDNFSRTIKRITDEREDYRIKAVVCFARNEDEQNEIYNLIGDAISNDRYHRLVFIDASSNLINREVFTRWIENSANERYWRSKEPSLADKMKNNVADCLKEWYNSFANGSFVYYPATKNYNDERKKISCQGIYRIIAELKDNVRRLYPYSFDEANITDTLFLSNNLRKLSEAGIKQEEFSMLKAKSIKIVLGDAWQMSGKYWEVYPDVSISRLKIELDALIKGEIDKKSNISFDKIFAYLLECGFMPLNIYAFLTGFLLKEYAGDPYRFSAGIDGNLGGAMNDTKLAVFIGEIIKKAQTPARNHRPKYLEIMSPNQRQFMLFAAEIFDVTEDVSVEQSAQKLRLKLKNLGYPLWCYVDAAEDRYKNFLRLLAEIANSKQAVSISALAERAGLFLIDNPAAFRDLKIFLTPQKGCEIFTDFVKNFEDGIIFDLAQKIGIENPVAQCQRRVASGDDIWLHDKETATDDLKKLIVDWKIVAESYKFSIDGKSFNACLRSWADYCRFNLKIPADTIGEYYPAIKNFLATLKDIVLRSDLPQVKREFFLCQLIDNAETIREALTSPLKVMRDKYFYQLEGLNETEIKEMYSFLSTNSFIDSQGRYHKNVDDLAKKVKGKQRKNFLSTLWQKVAGNQSPREWSKAHRTPILAMVPQAEQGKAKKIFETVMANSPDERAVQDAITYLEQPPSYFATLKDAQKVEEAFRRAIIGEESILLDDNDEVRNELELKFSGEAYEWYQSVRVAELVKKFAENKYYSGGACEKLTARVTRMSDEDAKRLLIDLLDKNYEVGMKLLREP